MRRGFTLIEVVVAMALMGIFLIAVERVFVAAYSASSSGTQTTQMFRSAALGFDQMGRELRMCVKIYYPDAATLSAGYSPRQSVNRPFVFRRYDANSNSDQAVAFTMNDQAHTFTRILYDPAFDPNNVASWTVHDPSRQILLLSQSVQNLKFTSSVTNGQNFVQIDIASFPQASIFPLESSIAIRGL